MNKPIYRSARGKMIDIDQLRLRNEESIAVGNMKVNARGDELGPGGEIVRTRNEIMKEYYQLNTPTVGQATRVVADETQLAPKAPVVEPGTLRGSLADMVSKSEDQ